MAITQQRLHVATVLAGTLVSASLSFAAPLTLISINTSVVSTGVTTTRTGLIGVTGSAGNGPYSVTYDGVELRLNSFVTSNAKIGNPVANGTAVARRNTATETGTSPTSSNPNQVNAWNALVSGGSTATQTVRGRYFNNLSDLYTSQNLWTGTENLMVNADAQAGNARSNVERIDYLFTPFNVSTDKGFLAFDRGTPGSSGANGPFKAAAITGIDSFGNPTFTGSAVVTVTLNSYGTGLLYTPTRYDVIERRDLNPGFTTELNQVRNDNIGPQGVSGVFIPFIDLVALGTSVYGYAVFGTDVTGTGANLNDWTNSTYFPINSPITNDLDYVASGAVIYSIPEPTALSLMALGTLALLHRRRR